MSVRLISTGTVCFNWVAARITLTTGVLIFITLSLLVSGVALLRTLRPQFNAVLLYVDGTENPSVRREAAR